MSLRPHSQQEVNSASGKGVHCHAVSSVSLACGEDVMLACSPRSCSLGDLFTDYTRPFSHTLWGVYTCMGKSLSSALVEHAVENITAQHGSSLLPVASEHLAGASGPEELNGSFCSP